MEAGSDLLAWVRTLLSDTGSLAVVNGYHSRVVPMKAGVRQGCPLAPLLYLFAAQALLCWLQHNNVGITLSVGDPQLTTAVQFADDTEVVLEGVSEVPRFLECMDKYAQASGQKLNLDKVEVLPVGPEQPGGAPGEPPGIGTGGTLGGLKVVATAVALNLPFTGTGNDPSMDWDPRVESAKARFSRIARLSLSVFGRATAAGAYGLHRLTWHMEHGGSPPPAVLDQLARMGAGLVDRGLAPPTQQPHRATGVPRRLLPGHPTGGGLGCSPWWSTCGRGGRGGL